MKKLMDLLRNFLVIPATIFVVLIVTLIGIWGVEWVLGLSFWWALFVILFLWGIIWGLFYLFGATLILPLIELAPNKKFGMQVVMIAFGINNFILLVMIWTQLDAANFWMKLLLTLFLANFTYSIMTITKMIGTGKMPANTKK